MRPLSSEATAWVRQFEKRWFEGADRKQIISIAKRYYPAEAWEEIQRRFDIGEVIAPKANDADDTQWWLDRITRFSRDYHNPTVRWRELMGMRSVLTGEGAHPRPYVLHRLDLAIQEAEADGADTDPKGIYLASQNLVESVQRLVRRATTGKAEGPSGGL